LKLKKKDIERVLSEADTARFYSDWKYSAVHMMSTLQRKPNLNDIMDRLDLDRQEATKIINFLLETGMILEKNYKYHEGISKTVLTKTSPYLVQHLSNWRIKALSDLAKREENEIAFSTNFTLSKKDFETLRKQIVALVNSFMPLIDASPAEELAYLNIDLRRM
jgi:DNA-binding MarR family transcriptional regulator